MNNLPLNATQTFAESIVCRFANLGVCKQEWLEYALCKGGCICRGGLQIFSLQTSTSQYLCGFQRFAGLFAEPIYKCIAGSTEPLLFLYYFWSDIRRLKN